MDDKPDPAFGVWAAGGTASTNARVARGVKRAKFIARGDHDVILGKSEVGPLFR